MRISRNRAVQDAAAGWNTLTWEKMKVNFNF